MAAINFAPIIIERLKVLRKVAPDLTFGDILYSILRDANLQIPIKKEGINWLRQITDEQYYKSIERLMIEEEQYKTDTNERNS